MYVCVYFIHIRIYIKYTYSYVRTPNISFKYYIVLLQLFCTLICRAKLQFANQNMLLTVATV